MDALQIIQSSPKKKILLTCLLATCLLALAAGVFTPEVALADRTVYVSNSGIYHFDSSCSGMKHYTTMSHSAADAAGYTPCKKCASGSSGASAVTTTKSSAKAGWKSSAFGWWYQNANGSYPKKAWKKIGGVWYYFDGSGYMATGWTKVSGKWYYLGSNGKMVTGWKKIDGNWYYFNNSGAMKTGWQKVKNKWYYLDGSGVMQTGLKDISGKTYYLNNSGVMYTGWQKIKGIWYYFNKSGAMQKSKWVGNYYLQADGSMATNRWVGKYYVGKDGAWVKSAKGESATGVGSSTLHYSSKYFECDLPSSWKGKWTITGYVDENRASIGKPNYTYVVYVDDKEVCTLHAHLYNIGAPEWPNKMVTSSNGYYVYLFNKGTLSPSEQQYLEDSLKAK